MVQSSRWRPRAILRRGTAYRGRYDQGQRVSPLGFWKFLPDNGSGDEQTASKISPWQRTPSMLGHEFFPNWVRPLQEDRLKPNIKLESKLGSSIWQWPVKGTTLLKVGRKLQPFFSKMLCRRTGEEPSSLLPGSSQKTGQSRYILRDGRRLAMRIRHMASFAGAPNALMGNAALPTSLGLTVRPTQSWCFPKSCHAVKPSATRALTRFSRWRNRAASGEEPDILVIRWETVL